MSSTHLAADSIDPTEAATSNDSTNDYCDDDRDYEPPVPYDHRAPWQDAAELWAFEQAKRLVAIHEGKPEFYENLDASIIEQWLFDDYPELIDALRSQQSLDSFRTELVHFCARMTAAGAYSQVLLTGWRVETHADIPATFPELTYPRNVDVDRCWNAQLPVEVATLYDRQRRATLGYTWHSDHMAPHSRLNLDVMTRFDLAKVRESSGDTGYVLNSDFSPVGLRLPDEKLILVARAPTGATEQSLTSWKYSYTRRTELPDGTIEATSVFAGGHLLMPLARHENFFRQLRSRLPVLFVFDDYLLLVGYKWNLIEFGTTRFERLRQEDSGQGISKTPLLSRLSTTDGLLIEHLRPLPTQESPEPTCSSSDSWDDVPF